MSVLYTFALPKKLKVRMFCCCFSLLRGEVYHGYLPSVSFSAPIYPYLFLPHDMCVQGRTPPIFARVALPSAVSFQNIDCAVINMSRTS
jgi:hypothetical protein